MPSGSRRDGQCALFVYIHPFIWFVLGDHVWKERVWNSVQRQRCFWIIWVKALLQIGSAAAFGSEKRSNCSATLVAAKLLLVYIGVSLLLPEGEDEGGGHAQGNLLTAIRTIMIADLVMSLDNVVAVAAAAMGDTTLLVLGLAISIPLVIFGSTLLLKVIERFPVIVWVGAALLASSRASCWLAIRRCRNPWRASTARWASRSTASS